MVQTHLSIMCIPQLLLVIQVEFYIDGLKEVKLAP